MNVKVEEVMVTQVISTHERKSIGHARDIMQKNNVHSLPIVDAENKVVGIITINDIVEGVSDDTTINHVMSKKVLTIPKYSGIHVAARIMRNHHIHHLVVTHEKELVGVLSSLDLLQFVEEHRFVSKNAPTESKKSGGRI
jgi:CBS domain-containing protein